MDVSWTCPARGPSRAALREEAEARRVGVGVRLAKWRHRHRRAAGQLHVPQLANVGVDYLLSARGVERRGSLPRRRRRPVGCLVGVNVDDPPHREGEHHVEEEDLVAPDDALLVGLLVEPRGPLVLHEPVLKAERLWNRLGHVVIVSRTCPRPRSMPSAAAIAGSEPMKAGERKFLRNQNLTCRFVRCSTDCSMILRKRSYKCLRAQTPAHRNGRPAASPPTGMCVAVPRREREDVHSLAGVALLAARPPLSHRSNHARRALAAVARAGAAGRLALLVVVEYRDLLTARGVIGRRSRSAPARYRRDSAAPTRAQAASARAAGCLRP